MVHLAPVGEGSLMYRKRIEVTFYRSSSGREPVRDWILQLDSMDRKIVGEDIKTVEFGWPIGMPTCKPMTGHKGLYEVRSDISNGRIARVLFVIEGSDMVLLHAFIKKTQKTPQADIDIAVQRRRRLTK